MYLFLKVFSEIAAHVTLKEPLCHSVVTGGAWLHFANEARAGRFKCVEMAFLNTPSRS